MSLLVSWACGGGDLALPSETPPQIEVVQGNGQRAAPGSPLADPLVVRLMEEGGSGISGRAVAWVVSAGGGTIDPASDTTDAEGFASAEWTLGQSAGQNRASAEVLGAGVVAFTAVGTDDDGDGEEAEVDRLVFLVPPGDVEENQTFSVEVALVDPAGDVVPLSGIVIYLGLFPDGKDAPANRHLRGERFEGTEAGIAVFDVAVEKKGRYRLRALTDDLLELGPHGPEPHLFSDLFEVE
jgi:hypothetical protein